MTGTLSQGRRIQNQEEEVQLFASSSKHQFDADCTYPECYSWSVTNPGDCNFDAGGHQTVQAPISACSGWFRAYRWYKLQFQLREHTIGGLPQLNNGGTVRPEENTNLTEYSDIPPRGVDVTTTLFLITLMQIGGNGIIRFPSVITIEICLNLLIYLALEMPNWIRQAKKQRRPKVKVGNHCFIFYKR